ncbi:hypothetical protein SUGI_1224040 [Cryptomeria japonica]|uniref:Uncharacterized protein n=1 Tax=Cryptomeria japonica TaxID=3369 RepID=A0AAD3NNU3_CRYJA|nr:hypothetical protein SUGI_1224040 [Cryptomeria japonica]
MCGFREHSSIFRFGSLSIRIRNTGGTHSSWGAHVPRESAVRLGPYRAVRAPAMAKGRCYAGWGRRPRQKSNHRNPFPGGGRGSMLRIESINYYSMGPTIALLGLELGGGEF